MDDSSVKCCCWTLEAGTKKRRSTLWTHATKRRSALWTHVQNRRSTLWTIFIWIVPFMRIHDVLFTALPSAIDHTLCWCHATVSDLGTSRALGRVRRREGLRVSASPCFLHISVSHKRQFRSHSVAASPANAGKAVATRIVTSRRFFWCSKPTQFFLPCTRSAAS